MGKTNSISLNGRTYDSRTGQPLPAAAGSVHFVDLAPPKPSLQPIAKRPVVDGFVRAGDAKQLHVAPHKSATLRRMAPKPILKAPATTSKSAITAPKPASAHQLNKSATLMRHVVSKPVIARKPALKPQSNTAALVVQPAHGITRKRMSDVVDDSRLVRAVKTPQHHQVSRFTKGPTLQITTPHLAVIPVATAPKATVTAAPATDMFSQALASATSHEQTYSPPKQRRHGRLVATGAASLVLLLSVVGVAYFNRTNIQMQFASAQAGFDAHLPNFTPDGYSFRGIDQQPGRVTVSYSANRFESSYGLIEQASAWNSQTLLDTFVSTSHQDYHSREQAGMTIYFYGENAATWVNGGVWYRFDAKGQALTEAQILQIITSIN